MEIKEQRCLKLKKICFLLRAFSIISVPAIISFANLRQMNIVGFRRKFRKKITQTEGEENK